MKRVQQKQQGDIVLPMIKSIFSGTLHFSSSTTLIIHNCCPVSLPHHRVSQTHGSSATLLLSHIPIDVPYTHPPASSPGTSCLGAHSPLGVVLAGLKFRRLSRVYSCDVQDLPSQGAVRRKDPCGTNPELDQEVRLEGRGHPGMVEV